MYIVYYFFVVKFALLLILWGPKAATFVNLVMATFTLGGVMLITYMKFYYKSQTEISCSVSTNISMNETFYRESNLVNWTSACGEVVYPETFNFLYFPYFLCALLLFLSAFSFLVITLLPTPDKIKYLLQNTRKNTKTCITSCKEGCMIDKYSLIILLCCIFSNIINAACFSSFVAYIFSVAYEANIGFTGESAALLALITVTVMTISRIIFGVVTHFISVKIVVLILTMATLISDIALVSFGMGSMVSFWICVTLKSALIGSVSSNLLPFYDKYVKFTGKQIALFRLTYTFGQGAQYLLNGYIIEHLGAWYNLVVGLIFSLILVCTIYFIFMMERSSCLLKNKTLPEEETLLKDE